MGCCNSKDFITANAPSQTKMEIGGSASADEKKASTSEGILKGSGVQLKVFLPGGESFQNRTDEDSPRTPSPTMVSQRSRSAKKSVTFNPISIVKEYPRNSSSADKNVTTYICSQLGLDSLSETDSQCDNEAPDVDVTSPEVQLAAHVEYGGGEYGSEYEYGDYQDWYQYQQWLAAEQGISEDHPSYLPGYDYDYRTAAAVAPALAGQGMRQRGREREEQEQEEEDEYEGGLCGASSYRETSSCVWVCA